MNKEIFRNYFKYQNPSNLVKDLFKANKNKNEKIKYLIIIELIKLMEDINIKEIPENENPKKLVNIVENSLILINKKKVQVSKN